MPTTSNFGWTTPADTDLVKDGALAIRTLGNGIDTSFLDLKGGTTGQVLSKASNTDLDFSWVAQDDIDAIQKSLIDAEGDLIVGDAADAVQRLAIGSNGNVLTVDTSVDGKIKWAAPAGISWTTWSPTYSNLTIGNGTVVARYAYSGGLVVVQWQLTWGSTTSFTGAPTISNLPYNVKNRGAGFGYLQAANVNYPWFVSLSEGSGSFSLYAINASGTYAGQTALSNTVPGSFSNAQPDYLGIYFTYEAN